MDGERLRCRVVERGADYAKCLLWYEGDGMSERVIGKAVEIDAAPPSPDGNRTVRTEFVPDPDAPSLTEVVEAMREARQACAYGGFELENAAVHRLDDLIARLEAT